MNRWYTYFSNYSRRKITSACKFLEEYFKKMRKNQKCWMTFPNYSETNRTGHENINAPTYINASAYYANRTRHAHYYEANRTRHQLTFSMYIYKCTNICMKMIQDMHIFPIWTKNHKCKLFSLNNTFMKSIGIAGILSKLKK